MENEVMVNAEVRTTEIIATEINTTCRLVRHYLVSGAVDIGNKLIEVKELVPHGEWGDWLKNNVYFSERKAQAYMQIARANPDVLKTAEYGGFSISNTLRLIALPDEAQDEVVDAVENEGISGEDAVARIAELEEYVKDVENKNVDLLNDFTIATNDKEATLKKFNEIESERDKAQKQLAEQAETLTAEIEKAVANAKRELADNARNATEAELEAYKQQLADAEEALVKAKKDLALASSTTKTKFKLLVDDIQVKTNEAINVIAGDPELSQENQDKLKYALHTVLITLAERLEIKEA